jgi:hypothetical protein
MNSLKAYRTIIEHVTKTNHLAAQLRDEEITKTDALKEFKSILEKAQESID